jgi:hypothetical protein
MHFLPFGPLAEFANPDKPLPQSRRNLRNQALLVVRNESLTTGRSRSHCHRSGDGRWPRFDSVRLLRRGLDHRDFHGHCVRVLGCSEHTVALPNHSCAEPCVMDAPAPQYSFHFSHTLNHRTSNLRHLNQDVTATLLCIFVTCVLLSSPRSGRSASAENGPGDGERTTGRSHCRRRVVA